MRIHARLFVAFCLLVSGTLAGAAELCPSANQNVDYNCPFGPTFVIPGLTDLGGWDLPSRYRTLMNGDISGDGKDELVIRGPAGINVYEFNIAAGQWSLNAANLPLTDGIAWNQEKYYSTLQLAAINAVPTYVRQLVGRGQGGMAVWSFAPGETPGSGSWTRIMQFGPMGDAVCFSNGKCWGDDPAYYSTIKVGDFFRFGTATLFGRGGDGLEVYRWDSSTSTWKSVAPVLAALSDANGYTNPAYYSTIIASPRQNGNIYVAARAPDGMAVYELDFSGGVPGVWRTVQTGGPLGDKSCFANGKCWGDGPEYWSTIREYPLAPTGLALIGRGADGLEIWNFVGPGWQRASTPGTGPFKDSEGFSAPQYYQTLRIADLAGDGTFQMIGRNATGIVGYNITGSALWSPTFPPGQLQLADVPWGTDPSYYTTLRVVYLAIDDNGYSAGPAMLVGRGPSGIRTWRYTPAGWSRYVPYGNYPALDPTALVALDTFLGIAEGTIRTVYTAPDANPTASELQGYQTRIQQTCTQPLPGNPPQYESCTTPLGLGVSNAAWTTISNQIIAELFWATQAVNRFDTIAGIQSQLFVDENSEFPSITADLRLGDETNNVVAKLDYLGLFGSIFELLGALFPIPELSMIFSLTGDAIAVAQAATPTLSGSKPSVFDQTYAQIQGEIAAIEQETQDALLDHQRYVLGDYGLMSTVGNLVASQIWQIDAGSALSASRQQFTRWVYQGFLPAVWDLWDMSYCNTDTGETTYGIQICFPPPQELGISYYSTGYYETSDGGNYAYTSFVGLLPRQTPCAQGPYGFYYCHFVSLQSHGYGPALTSLFTPVSTACSYNPSAGTAWTYDNCTLGVTYAEIGQPSIWNFANYTCEYNYPGDDVTFTTCAAIEPRMSLRKAEVGGDGTAELTLTIRLTQPLDVNRTTLTLHSFARETGDAEELFASATPFPRVLTPPATRHRSLSLVSRPGEVPRMSARLAIHGDVLVIQLLAESVGLANLPRCNGDDTLRTMFLTTQITVDDGIHRPQQGIVTAPWQCSSHAGRLRLSRPLALGP